MGLAPQAVAGSIYKEEAFYQYRKHVDVNFQKYLQMFAGIQHYWGFLRTEMYTCTFFDDLHCFTIEILNKTMLVHTLILSHHVLLGTDLQNASAKIQPADGLHHVYRILNEAGIIFVDVASIR